MKDIGRIYRADLNSMVAKWMTLVVIGGLIVLPSLYAWLNIKASWDPYGKTDQIPIGFVNKDEGAVIQDEHVDVGDDLVEQLKEDDNFSWHFVDEAEGMEEVEYGNFYATIVVPEDFSETLGSVITSKPEKAEINYFVNEKINAIAPKITDKGASVIVEEISSQFISTVNGIIFEMFNEIGLELEESLPDIELFESYVFMLEEQLPLIHDQLRETDAQLDEAEQYVANAKSYLPKATEVTNVGKDAINETNQFLEKVEAEIKSLSPNVKDAAGDLEETFETLETHQQSLEETFSDTIDEFDAATINEGIDELVDELAKLEEELKGIESELTEPKEELTSVIDQIDTMQTNLTNLRSETDALETFVDQNKDVFETMQTNVDELSDLDIEQFLTAFDESVEAKLLEEVERAKETVRRSGEALEKIEETIPEIERMIGTVEQKITDGKEVIASLLKKYPSLYAQVEELADRIRKVQSEADIQQIIELLLNDPEAEKGFFKEPVMLHKNEVFPIENYGTGMTPFYTVLSLWVGGLLLISLLTPNVPGQAELNPKVVYTGRLLTFVTIGIFQTLIVTLGDIFILQVSIAHKVWFVIFGLLISFVFMSIVYTAVAILGDVGKAVAIILLVLQIASSGGTYPVVLLPEFFQTIHPVLPFTYGVDLMREAVGGIIWKRALKDIIALVIFATITLLIGLFLKGPVEKRMSKMTESKGGRLF